MAEAGRKSDNMRRFSFKPSLDAGMAELAGRQHSVFSLRQLRELGMGARAVQHRAAHGRLHRVHPSVYSLAPTALLTREGWWMAAILAAGPQAVLSHGKAAALHALLTCNRAKVEVTVPGRVVRTRSGIDVHRSTTLTEADRTVVNGIPCTTVARTLLDLAAVVEPRRPERAFDQAEI